MIPRWVPVTFGVSARRAVRDPGPLVLTGAFYLVVTTVMGALWRAAVASKGSDLAGYGGVELSWYLAATEAMTIAVASRLIERVGDDITTGAVAVDLLRPAPVLGVRVVAELGTCLPKLGICLALGLPLAWLTAGPPPRLATLPLVALAAVLGVACNVVGQHLVAASAFWLRNTGAAWFVYQKLIFVLGGMLLPLQVMPGVLRAIAWALPFQAMAYPAGRLAAGHVEPTLLLGQAAWLSLLWLGAVAAFGAGERRLQVVGG